MMVRGWELQVSAFQGHDKITFCSSLLDLNVAILNVDRSQANCKTDVDKTRCDLMMNIKHTKGNGFCLFGALFKR